MIDTGFNAAKAQLDEIRRDVEKKRFELLNEKERIERESKEHESRCNKMLAEEIAKKNKEMEHFKQELEIRLKKAREGREEAEILAKAVTVGSLVAAVTDTGMVKE